MAVDRFFKTLPAYIKRPYTSLVEAEIACLEMYHFSNMPFDKIYSLFFTTSGMSPANIKKLSNQLLDSVDAQTFLEDRKRQLELFFSKDNNEDDSISKYLDENGNFHADVLKKIKTKALETGLDSTDSKVFEMLLSMLIKQEGQQQDVESQTPIIVLAEQCRTCRYRIHIEENYDDACKKCKYQVNSDIKYNHKTQFEDGN